MSDRRGSQRRKIVRSQAFEDLSEDSEEKAARPKVGEAEATRPKVVEAEIKGKTAGDFNRTVAETKEKPPAGRRTSFRKSSISSQDTKNKDNEIEMAELSQAASARRKRWRLGVHQPSQGSFTSEFSEDTPTSPKRKGMRGKHGGKFQPLRKRPGYDVEITDSEDSEENLSCRSSISLTDVHTEMEKTYVNASIDKLAERLGQIEETQDEQLDFHDEFCVEEETEEEEDKDLETALSEKYFISTSSPSSGDILAMHQSLVDRQATEEEKLAKEKSVLLDRIDVMGGSIRVQRPTTSKQQVISWRQNLKKWQYEFFRRYPVFHTFVSHIDILAVIVLCASYIGRVLFDQPDQYACRGLPCNGSEPDDYMYHKIRVNGFLLLWMYRTWSLYVVEMVYAFYLLSRFIVFMGHKVKKKNYSELCSIQMLVLMTSVLPSCLTVVHPHLLRHFYSPTYVSCWLIIPALRRMGYYHGRELQTISVRLKFDGIVLGVTIFNTLFTTACGFHYLQRAGDSPVNFFESFYFTVVTFSTVGYGDFSPDNPLSRSFIIVMIFFSLIMFTDKLNDLLTTMKERNKEGQDYEMKGTGHLVVCVTTITTNIVTDFLQELHAHPHLRDRYVVFLSPSEVDIKVQAVFKNHLWADYVFYIRGSALKQYDLMRCRLQQAEACFFLASRMSSDQEKSDQHTVLRAWAVKEYAPHCKQYIQLYKAKNKMHVHFAHHLVCEDEFKHALLAKNCLFPGLSTVVSLIVHCPAALKPYFPKIEDSAYLKNWIRMYGHHCSNEIFHIKLKTSTMFQQYKGVCFPDASAAAHKRYGVTMVAVITSGKGDAPRKLLLNPGMGHILRNNDYVVYMSVKQEETLPESEATSIPHHWFSSSTSLGGSVVSSRRSSVVSPFRRRQRSESRSRLPYYRRESVLSYPTSDESAHGEDSQPTRAKRLWQMLRSKQREQHENKRLLFEEIDEGPFIEKLHYLQTKDEDSLGYRHRTGKLLHIFTDLKDQLTEGRPQLTLSTGSERAFCHMMKNKRHKCCLKWGQTCEHCDYKSARDHRWRRRLIILAARECTHGLFNFIIAIRSSVISMQCLNGIVLLLESSPDSLFLNFISDFPLIYYMEGHIDNVDDLQRAGINLASHFVLASRENTSFEVDSIEETLVDAEALVCAETICRLYPKVHMVTELRQANNMRFLQSPEIIQKMFRSQLQEVKKLLSFPMESNKDYMFHPGFMSGQVFSGAMLDTLLYQSFVKGYLITFVRLLLDLDSEPNCGHLSSIRVTEKMVATCKTYQGLYDKLTKGSGEIPIAVYRSHNVRMSEPKKRQSRDLGRSKSAPKKLKESQNPNDSLSFGDKGQINISRLSHGSMQRSDTQDSTGYVNNKTQMQTFSYVILNPYKEFKLQQWDIVYAFYTVNHANKAKRNPLTPSPAGSWWIRYVIQPSQLRARPFRPRKDRHMSDPISAQSSFQ